MFWIGMLIAAMVFALPAFIAACAMSKGKRSDQQAEDVFEQMQREARKAGQ